MPIKSNRDGSCYDCGKPWKEGDEIDSNGHKTKAGKDYWCKDGKNCQGAMQMTGSVASPPPAAKQSRISVEELSANFNSLTAADKERDIGIAIRNYIQTLNICGAVGITEPPVIGMIYKCVMDRLR